MRNAIAMIELIFAIVIIAISVLSIPSMLSIANNAAKVTLLDDDVLSRLSGWVTDKSQARWDRNYAASGSGILWINTADLNCSRGNGFVYYRANVDSTVMCDDVNRTSSVIPNPSTDGNLSLGIEQLNGGSETITITPTGGGVPYSVTASYSVRYVNASLDAINGNTATATWTLGSSDNMAPDGSLTNVTNLKRIVTRFSDAGSNTDVALTFFKSNKGN